MSRPIFFRISAIILTTAVLFGASELHSATLPTKGLSAIEATSTADARSLNETELLGKRIFEDTSMSEPRGQACASCHEPKKAFQGNNHSPIASLAQGSNPGSFGTRNVPTLMYAALTPAFSFVAEKNEEGKIENTPTGGLFLDGRADTLPEQAAGPLLNKVEMNNPSKEAVVAKLKQANYAPLFEKVYGAKVLDDTDGAFDKAMAAIAAFESTSRFMPFTSKFDAYLQGKEQLTAEEAKGFELFKDKEKGNCLACHAGKEDSHDPHEWAFTDYTYDGFGAPRNMDVPANIDPKYYDMGLCQRDGIKKLLPKGMKATELCGAFKVPTLRDIALTGPYMHNGVFNSLRDVVKFYATRDTNPELWYPKDAHGKPQKFNDLPRAYHENVNVKEVPYNRKPGEKPALDDAEIDAIVAFLNTLTDRTLAH